MITHTNKLEAQQTWQIAIKISDVNFVWLKDPPTAPIVNEPFTIEFGLQFDEYNGYEKFMSWLVENDWLDAAE